MNSSIFRLFKEYYGTEAKTVTPIKGSGSNRCYFRMSSPSAIGTIGQEKRENQAFIYLDRHFLSKGLPVPRIFAVADDLSAYLQEDMGEVMLNDVVDNARKSGDFGPITAILEQCMRQLVRFQFDAGEDLDYSQCYPQAAFDRRMLSFDLNYFKYCFLKSSGLEFDENALEDDFHTFASLLMECDRFGNTFMFRDFQSRNVILRGSQAYFIDFQGGRRGPVHYDLVSFVWQVRAAYPEALREHLVETYIEAAGQRLGDIERFRAELLRFRLLRLLQVLGAYGFRGLVEHKAKFTTMIVPALAQLQSLLDEAGEEFSKIPYLINTLRRLCHLKRFAPLSYDDKRLTVRVYSFSYMKGIPEDLSGNGGGYTFDCRGIHNPGRYEQYKKLTGLDEEVIKFLEDDGEMTVFLEHAKDMVAPHVKRFIERGFSDMSIAFGCTGGQHRSVYGAQHMAEYLAESFPKARIHLIHRERGIEKIYNE